MIIEEKIIKGIIYLPGVFYFNQAGNSSYINGQSPTCYKLINFASSWIPGYIIYKQIII